MYATDKIFEVAKETPGERAMVFNLEPISYRRLHLSITNMRRSLSRHNLKPGAIAVLFIETIPVAWVVDLALRTLGLTTVALRTPDELGGLKDLDVVALVTVAGETSSKGDLALLPGVRRIIVEPSDWIVEDHGGALEPPPATPSGGHIVLTSGTTGRYKMVLMDAAFEEADRATPVEMYNSIDGLLHLADGRLGVINLLSFGLWTAPGYTVPIRYWGDGGTVIIHQAPSPHVSLAVPGINHLAAPPAFLVHLMSLPPGAFQRNDDLQVLAVGGALSLPLANQVKARLTRRVATTIGSTETGAWGMTPIDTDEDLRWNRIHPSRVVEIVDEDDRPMPVGAHGRVRVLQNNGLAGYLNDPEATAEFFRDGYFYSGDLGAMDAQGRLALYGRATDVLAVLGDKYPAGPYEEEIQTALGIHGVCLLTEQSEQASELLHLVIETPEPLDVARIQAVMPADLAAFPQFRVHFVEVLPRNQTGKIDRIRLRQQLIEDSRRKRA